MKNFIKEYLEVLTYTICGILIIIGAYNIIININHTRYLSEKIVVREIDSTFRELKDNVIMLEDILSKSNNNSSLKRGLQYSLNILKKEGAYRLLPGDVLGYNDVYELNNYFLDQLINESWVSNLKTVDNNKIDNRYVEVLINNANYVNKELLNNSNFCYDVKDNNIRNPLQEEYNLVLKNYKDYSFLLIELTKRLGENNA